MRQATTAATITTDAVPGQLPVVLRFGTQTDARPVRHGGELPGTGHGLSVQAVANYIAKYATKALDAPGIPDRPIRSALDLDGLRCNRHHTRMITTAWRLGGGKLTPGRTRLCKWAHMLGYSGHFLTKSRRYSTTFTVLRRARTEYRKRQRHPSGEHDPWGALSMSAWSSSCTPGSTPAPATPPTRAQNSRSPRPPGLAPMVRPVLLPDSDDHPRSDVS